MVTETEQNALKEKHPLKQGLKQQTNNKYRRDLKV